MSTVIIACSSLEAYLKIAQEKEGTNYPVVLIDRSHHVEPKRMKQIIADEEKKLPADVDTVLVAMGFCGGVWDQVEFPRKTVIPRVDDCVTLMLQKTDDYVANLKEMGHMYMMEIDPDDFNMAKIMPNLEEEFKDIDIEPEELYRMFFGNYTHLDIIDTGLNDCYSEEYVMKAQANADLMEVVLDYTEGSNHLLEKLVGGRWDEQFLIAEPGHLMRHGDFFE
ncbi:MAG: DUF1638 domain-containing protein [Clostridia bacterium]|nr:DUF1638 domain-containing protein [Clostridia bacterium]